MADRYKFTSGRSITREFGGKRYNLFMQTETKRVAKDWADALRGWGWFARVIPNDLNPSEGYKWLVFRRSKRSKQ